MTKAELRKILTALKRIDRAIATCDADETDQVGGKLYPVINRIASDVTLGIDTIDAALRSDA